MSHLSSALFLRREMNVDECFFPARPDECRLASRTNHVLGCPYIWSY